MKIHKATQCLILPTREKKQNTYKEETIRLQLQQLKPEDNRVIFSVCQEKKITA